jgi:hypothetical protein
LLLYSSKPSLGVYQLAGHFTSSTRPHQLSLFIGLKLTDEFTSLKEPTRVFDFAADVVFPTDGPEFIKSERQTEPRDLMRKLRLTIIRSISLSKFAKTRDRVGG